MLRNLIDYVIIPFLASGMSRNLTNCASMLSLDFRRVTEFHGLRNDASFLFPACLGTSRIVQQRVLSTSKLSNKGYMPWNNGPRTKLGYDSFPLMIVNSLLDSCRSFWRQFLLSSFFNIWHNNFSGDWSKGSSNSNWKNYQAIFTTGQPITT